MSSFGLIDLVTEMGDDVVVQQLSTTFTGAKARKDCNEISFITDQAFNTDGMDKECLMVWVDKAAFNAALDKVKGVTDEH